MATPRVLACVVGTRPNFVKAAALVREIERREGLACRLIHTGQHNAPEMSELFFEQLGLPRPDVSLEAGGIAPDEQPRRMPELLAEELRRRRPCCVVVVGDVASTLAGAQAAAAEKIPLAHVEAGLRSGDLSMPEERNRIAVDRIADWLFASEPSGVNNLLAEGLPAERIHFAGNVMIDTLLRYRGQAMRSDVLDRLGVRPKQYAAATLHRAANVDDLDRLRALFAALEEITERLPVVLPVHPRTRERLRSAGIRPSRLALAAPLGYLDFLKLIDQARLVLTDSGGVQEETTILGTPCLTLRENTERPVTIEQGTNRLAGVEPAGIVELALKTLRVCRRKPSAPERWDGQAARRVIDILEKDLDGK